MFGLVVSGELSNGQRLLTWQSTSSVEWGMAANWYDETLAGPAVSPPAAVDVVVIDGTRGGTVNVSVTAAGEACKGLTVKNGFRLVIEGSAGTLVVGDGVSGSIDIDIQGGGEIQNLSTTSGGYPFSLLKSSADRFRIAAGGKYVHNTARSFSTPFPATACDFDAESTVEFGQSSSSAVPASGRTYGNLVLSGTGTKSFSTSGSQPVTIRGTLTIAGDGVLLSVGTTGPHFVKNILIAGGALSFGSASNSITISGSITNNGTLTFSPNQAIQFNDSSWIGGLNPISFPNGFAITAGASVSLSTAISVGDTLGLAGGNLIAGDVNIRLDGIAVGGAAGQSIVTNGRGMVMRTLKGGESFQFPVSSTVGQYNPITLALAAEDSADLFGIGVLSGVIPAPPDPSEAVQCTWVITEGTPGNTHATVSFDWEGIQEGSRFKRSDAILIRFAGSQWVNAGLGVIVGADPFEFTAGNPVIEFSRFAVGTEAALPVQIASFKVSVLGDSAVRLEWSTESETNNYGFEVERTDGQAGRYRRISPLIPGAGTTLIHRQYGYLDSDPHPGKSFYRLRQTDLDGKAHLSESMEVHLNSGVTTRSQVRLTLLQNFPNPFNPETDILFYLPAEGKARLEVFNYLGERVATPVDGFLSAGYHRTRFNAASLPSGGYVLRMQSGPSVVMRRMMILK